MILFGRVGSSLRGHAFVPITGSAVNTKQTLNISARLLQYSDDRTFLPDNQTL